MNPFDPSRPAAGAQLAGRSSELELLDSAVRAGGRVVLVAPGGHGKTSLLLAAIEAVEARGGRTAYADLGWSDDERDVAQALVDALARGLRGLRLLPPAALAALRRRPGIDLVPGPDGTRCVIGGRGSWAEGAEVIRALARSLRESGPEAPPVIAIDGLERAATAGADVYGLVRTAAAGDLRGVAVLAATRAAGPSTAETRGPTPVLTRLRLVTPVRAALESSLRERAAAAGRPMTAGAAQAVLGLTEGVPGPAVALAAAAFDAAGAEMDEPAVTAGLESIVRRGHPLYEARLASLSGSQRRVLRALAERPESRPTSGAFLARAGMRAASSVQRALEALARSGLADAAGGAWRVSDPFCAEWLRRAGRTVGGTPGPRT